MNIDIEIVIADTLRELGIPANLKGYKILKEAINLCIEDESFIYSITKKLYPTLAKIFDTTASRIERNIRHAISSAWDRGDINVLYGYFGNTVDPNKGKTTNSEFIATIVEHIKMRKAFLTKK